MPRYIVKIKDKYLEWSTVTDRPYTIGMTLDEFRHWYKKEYGRTGMRDIDDRLERVEATGSSCYRNVPDNLEFLIDTNRAGKNGSKLTLDQIYKKYCEVKDGRYPEGH